MDESSWSARRRNCDWTCEKVENNSRTEGLRVPRGENKKKAVVNDKAKMLLGACMMVKGGGANLRGCGRVREGRDCQNSHENNEGKQCFAHEIL